MSDPTPGSETADPFRAVMEALFDQSPAPVEFTPEEREAWARVARIMAGLRQAGPPRLDAAAIVAAVLGGTGG